MCPKTFGIICWGLFISTASLSHMRTTLPEIGSRPLLDKWPNQANKSLFGSKTLYCIIFEQLCYFSHVQGSAKRRSPGLVKFVAAVTYYFCLALPGAITQPGDHLSAEPCISVHPSVVLQDGGQLHRLELVRCEHLAGSKGEPRLNRREREPLRGPCTNGVLQIY